MENKDITIKLPVQQWNVVMNALASRPYGEVADMIAHIKMQAEQQLKEQTPEDSGE